MSERDTSVNQRIKFLIDDYQKCSQKAFAEKIGISQSAVSALFSQRENRPGLEMLQKIAIAYPELNLSWLLIGEGPMLQVEAATAQKQSSLSAEQLAIVKREIRELVISALGLGPAQERQAKEAKSRAEQITALEVKTRTLKMRMDELTAQRQLLEGKTEMTDQDREQLASIRNAYAELSNDLYGSSQVLFTLQAEEKRDLREAHTLIGEMTQAVQAALKPATK